MNLQQTINNIIFSNNQMTVYKLDAILQKYLIYMAGSLLSFKALSLRNST